MGSPSSSNFPEAICDLQETAILGVDSTGKQFNLAAAFASTKTEWEIDLNGSALKITPFSTKKHLLIGTDAGRGISIGSRYEKDNYVLPRPPRVRFLVSPLMGTSKIL